MTGMKWKKPSPATIIATVALFIALSGGAYASVAINQVRSVHIKNGEVKSADIANNAVTGAKIRASAVSGSKVLDGSLEGVDLRDGSVTGADVADGTIGAADVLDGSVTGADLADGTVGAADIAAGVIPPAGVSPWDTIPSGQAVTGEIVWDYSAAATSSDRIGVTLPARAPIDLTTANVNFAPDASPATIDDDATCTGSLVAPTAPAGKVCIYRNNSGNLNSMNGAQNLSLRKSGFYIDMVPAVANTDTFLYATWAYTAP